MAACISRGLESGLFGQEGLKTGVHHDCRSGTNRSCFPHRRAATRTRTSVCPCFSLEPQTIGRLATNSPWLHPVFHTVHPVLFEPEKRSLPPHPIDRLPDGIKGKAAQHSPTRVAATIFPGGIHFSLSKQETTADKKDKEECGQRARDEDAARKIPGHDR